MGYRTIRKARFQALPLLTVSAGTRILQRNERRVGLIISNRGTGSGYISENTSDPESAFPLAPNDSINFFPNAAPTEAIFAWGDAAHDIRVLEVLDLSISREA